MANDAEYTTMNDGQLANNSITFVNQLKARNTLMLDTISNHFDLLKQCFLLLI